jgi:hypothetical protein
MLNYSQNSGKPLFNYRGGVEDTDLRKELRLKARMKFLIKDIEMNMRLLMRKAALSYQIIEIDTTDFDVAIPETLLEVPKVTIEDTVAFETWKIKCHSSKNKRVLRHRIKVFRRFLY